MKTFININLETFQPATNDEGEILEYQTKEKAQEASQYFLGEYYAQPSIKPRAKKVDEALDGVFFEGKVNGILIKQMLKLW